MHAYRPLRRSLCVSLVTAVPLLGIGVDTLAADYAYKAVDDFTDLEAGTVPYYRDTGHDALAINAANEAYRDLFAQATRVFDGESGVYDITLTTLGELDGEGDYRLYVDGVLIGEVKNTTTTTDYSEQTFVFDNVTVNNGMLIGVASTAVSNGAIPEGSGFAFARGRWRSLDLVADAGADPVDSVNLTLTAVLESANVGTGVSFPVTLSVANAAGSATATSPTLAITLPEGLSMTSDSACTSAEAVLSCTLAELAPGASADVVFDAMASVDGELVAVASVIADQADSDTSNNEVQLTINASSAPDGNTTGDTGDTTTTDGDGTGTGGTDGTTDSGTVDTGAESSSSSGSGASGLLALLVMLLVKLGVRCTRLAVKRNRVAR